MKKTHSVQELKGILSTQSRPVTIAAMNEAIESQACPVSDDRIPKLSDAKREVVSANLCRILPGILDALQLDTLTSGRVLGMPQDEYRLLVLGEACMSHEQIERASLLLGIYRALHELLPSHAATRWLHRPNAAYRGAKPLDSIVQGQLADLYAMRRYLDAECLTQVE